jgi:N-acetylmuramoyl-L-alanine amidase
MAHRNDPFSSAKRSERTGWVALVIAVLALFGAAAAIAANVGGRESAARSSAALGLVEVSAELREGATIAVLTFDAAARGARAFALSSPNPRLVVDIPNARSKLGAPAGSRDGAGLVRAIRFAQNGAATRVVFDLTQPAGPGAQVWRTTNFGRRHVLEITISAGASAAAPIVMSSPVASSSPAARRGKPIVVIDAGHGGKDPGAVGPTGLFEKTVTLASAQTLCRMLERTGRYEIVMTRESDVFIALEERVRRARAAQADLFISLHADSGASPELEGATVYTLSADGQRRARNLMSAQDWVIAAADQPRPGEVNDILVDLAQRETNNQSSLFARALLTELKPVGPLLRNSHREAAFFVLLAPDVPAVLLEMGFLTNADDERRLRDAAFRDRQMRAAADAINSYFDRRDPQSSDR